MRVYIDSNIPMYVAGKAHPNRRLARRFLARVQTGKVAGCTSTEVLQEILHRYSALERIDLGVEVYDLFVRLCPEVFDITLADTDRARDLLTDIDGISARDAIHAGVMFNQEIASIATFDTGFDRIPGIERMEL